MFFGIDPSTKCGVAAVRIVDGKPVLVKTDVIHNPTYKGLARARWITKYVLEFVNKHGLSDENMICIEGYSFGSAFRLVDMVEIGTMVRHMLTDSMYGYSLLVCPPSTLKVGVTGKGNAKKAEMILAAFKAWGWELPDDDRCDAACLAVMAACYHGKYAGDAKMRDAVGKIALCQ